MATKANEYDRGSSILIESTFTKAVPFGTTEALDPVTQTVTITDRAGTVIGAPLPMIQDSTGKYFVILQTEENWVAGKYNITIRINDGVYDDVSVTKNAFTLI